MAVGGGGGGGGVVCCVLCFIVAVVGGGGGGGCCCCCLSFFFYVLSVCWVCGGGRGGGVMSVWGCGRGVDFIIIITVYDQHPSYSIHSTLPNSALLYIPRYSTRSYNWSPRGFAVGKVMLG